MMCVHVKKQFSSHAIKTKFLFLLPFSFSSTACFLWVFFLCVYGKDEKVGVWKTMLDFPFWPSSETNKLLSLLLLLHSRSLSLFRCPFSFLINHSTYIFHATHVVHVSELSSSWFFLFFSPTSHLTSLKCWTRTQWVSGGRNRRNICGRHIQILTKHC